MRKRPLFVVSTECQHCGGRAGLTVPNETRRLLLLAEGSGALLMVRCPTRRCGRNVPLGRDAVEDAKLLSTMQMAKLQ